MSQANDFEGDAFLENALDDIVQGVIGVGDEQDGPNVVGDENAEDFDAREALIRVTLVINA